MCVKHYKVDRFHPLPPDYVPEDLVRAPVPFVAPLYDMKRCISLAMYDPLRRLFSACMRDGLNLMGVSAYRSYDRQKEIYEESIYKNGEIYARAHVAFPGTSEHQTGLAIDVSSPEINFDLCEEFEKTKEGIWLKENASRFGFIFSFTNENQIYTGYVNEPWHIKYIAEDETFYI